MGSFFYLNSIKLIIAVFYIVGLFPITLLQPTAVTRAAIYLTFVIHHGHESVVTCTIIDGLLNVARCCL